MPGEEGKEGGRGGGEEGPMKGDVLQVEKRKKGGKGKIYRFFFLPPKTEGEKEKKKRKKTSTPILINGKL